MKLLGIDYGEAKIGLALGDTESGLALPYKILKNSGFKNFISEIKNIIAAEKIEKIILGLPQNTQAKTATKAEEKIRAVGNDLAEALRLPLELQSEIFSTQAAQKLSVGQKLNGRDDDLAAMLILQSYLDKN